jgi:allophycocyanin beta subunit
MAMSNPSSNSRAAALNFLNTKVTDVVIQVGLLDKLRSLVQLSERRIRVVSAITSHTMVIIKETMARPSRLGHVFALNYTVRQYAACIRDLNYFLHSFLRVASYDILAGPYSTLDEQRVLNELGETLREKVAETLAAIYADMDIPLDATLEAIRIMQEVTVCVIDPEDSQITIETFDYLCARFPERAKAIIYSTGVTKSSKYNPSWEPKSCDEWLNQDKLSQQIQQSGVEDPSLEDSAEDFFEALSNAPYGLRKQVWREREVMAALYQHMTVWQKIPGFRSVSVGRREVKGKSRLVGIVKFAVYGTHLELIHNNAVIPSLINVDSSIAELKESEQEIPIVLEISDIFINYTAHSRLDTIFTSMSTTTLVIQSGDKIVGKSDNGPEGPGVTLTTFVLPKGSSYNSNVVHPHLLTVRHGVLGYTDINTCESQVHLKIGEVIYDATNFLAQSLAEKLDIAVVKLTTDRECLIKPYLRWVDEYPKKPVPISSGMPVQMFGGTSGHMLGVVDESMIMYPGPYQSIVPDFSVTIPCQPGDSGSLLVVGHNSKVPIPEFLEEYMSEDWTNLVYSMQGVLLAGSVSSVYGSKAIFRPMITVLHWLKLQPYLP